MFSNFCLLTVNIEFCWKYLQKGINHLAPKSDKHLISPYYILPESNMKVMKIEEMITN